jgi:putative transposase
MYRRVSSRIGADLRALTIELVFIQPGNPQQNAYVERYNRTVRYDWLNHYLFESIQDVQNRATQWLWIYNNERPNMALNGITPMMKLAAAQTSTFNLGY